MTDYNLRISVPDGARKFTADDIKQAMLNTYSMSLQPDNVTVYISSIDDDDPQIPDILPVLGDIPSPDPIVKQYSEDEDNRFTASVYREIDNKEDHHPNGGLAHDTKEQARKYARKFPGLWVYIVESRGKYYVDESGFLRPWEVLIHEGYGKYA